MSSSDTSNLPDNEAPSVVAAPNKRIKNELHLSILEERGLLKRLTDELSFAGSQAKAAWLSFRAEPREFLTREVNEFSRKIRTCASAKAFAGSLAILVVVCSAAVLALLRVGIASPANEPLITETLNPFEVVTLTLPALNDVPTSKVGIGYQGQGRLGFNSGGGEGSNTKIAKSRGGGGGGGEDTLKAQQGAIPEPSAIQARIANLPPSRVQALPVAGVDIDPALWKALPFPVYGNPQSNSSLTSSGPGKDGGMGDGRGMGIGEGDGPGYGPGQDGNLGGNRRSRGSFGEGGSRGCNTAGCGGTVFTVRQVDQRARLLAKPEPQYTEEARRNQIMGTVILRVVFSSSGEVTNIQAVKTLPFGLTERAIMAARRIRFVPAIKAGQPVSVHMQLEYNFNLY